MTQVPSSPTASDSGSGSDALLTTLKGQTTSKADSKTANTSFEAPDTPASAKDPAAVVDLSREAQDILALKTDQEVADRLQEVLTGKKKDTRDSNSSDAADKLFGVESSAPTDPNDFDRLQALKEAAANGFKGYDFDGMIEKFRGVKEGGTAIIDGRSDPKEDFVQSVVSSLAHAVANLESAGKTDEAQKLYDAVLNGTLQIEDPHTVEGLNFEYTVTVDRTEIGTNRSFKRHQNPVGDVKAALDASLAKTHGFGDDGAFYFNWEGKDADTDPAVPTSGT